MPASNSRLMHLPLASIIFILIMIQVIHGAVNVPVIQQTSGSCCTSIHGNAYQTFVMPRSGKIKRIEVVARMLYRAFYVSFRVYKGHGLGGTVLGYSSSPYALTNPENWRGVDFNPWIEVEEGQTYTFLFDCGSAEGYDCGASISGSNPYSGGVAGRYGSDDRYDDFRFKIFFGFDDCAVDAYWASDGNCALATLCRPGQYVLRATSESADRVCDDCPDGYFTDKENMVDCQLFKRCNADEFMSKEATKTSDRECTKATICNYETHFMERKHTTTADTVCTLLTPCPTHRYELKPPTETTDRICADIRACTALEYEIKPPSKTSNRVCKALTICDIGFEVDVDGTATTDRTCKQCEDGYFKEVAGQSYCEGCVECFGGEYEKQECTHKTKRICERCQDCSEGHYIAGGCMGDVNTLCEACPTQDDCPTQHYIDGVCNPMSSIPPTCKKCHATCQECSGPAPNQCKSCVESLVLHTDGTCVSDCGVGYWAIEGKCVKCPDGCNECKDASTCLECQQAPDPQRPPSPSDMYLFDGQCVPSCPSGYWKDREIGECLKCTPCQPGSRTVSTCQEFENIGCESCVLDKTYQPLENQNTCLDLTICEAGFETDVKPTLATDRVCRPCEEDEFQPENDIEECLDATICSETQHEIVGLTLTSNRVCQNSTVCKDTEFEFIAPTATADRVCADITICEPGEETLEPPTATSDRVCKSCDDEFFSIFIGQERCNATYKCVADQEYEVLAPTPTSDRVCEALTECPDGWWIEVPHTSTSDRICSDEVQYCSERMPGKLCRKCQPGYWLRSAKQCDSCPKGHKCPEGSVPEACEAGSFQPERGQDDCIPCAPGSAQAIQAQESCEPCLGNSLQPKEGKSTCDTMKEGYYGILGENSEIGFVDEEPCEEGYACENGEITVCLPGTFSKSKAAECSPCGTDKYQPLEASDSCFPIPAGFYGTNGTSLSTSTTIHECEAGYRCVNGLKSICPPGTWQSSTHQSTCIPCGIGFYSEEQGRTTNCEPITTGYYGLGSDPRRRTGQEICPSGHSCLNGELNECDSRSFQPDEGKIDCFACDLSCSSGLTNVRVDERFCDVQTGEAYCQDVTPPKGFLKLEPPVSMALECGIESYSEPGYTFLGQSEKGDTILVEGTVNTTIIGRYDITYTPADAVGNKGSSLSRSVKVEDTTAPIIALKGRDEERVVQGGSYIDAGVTVTDACDMDVKSRLVVFGTPIDVNTAGSNTITFSVTDISNNAATPVTRRVIVLDSATERRAVSTALTAFTTELERLTALRSSSRRDAYEGYNPADVEAARLVAYDAYIAAGGRLYLEDFEVELDVKYEASKTAPTNDNSDGTSPALIPGIAVGAVVIIVIIIVVAVILVQKNSKRVVTSMHLHDPTNEPTTTGLFNNPMFDKQQEKEQPPAYLPPDNSPYYSAINNSDATYAGVGVISDDGFHRNRSDSMSEFGFDRTYSGSSRDRSGSLSRTYSGPHGFGDDYGTTEALKSKTPTNATLYETPVNEDQTSRTVTVGSRDRTYSLADDNYRSGQQANYATHGSISMNDDAYKTRQTYYAMPGSFQDDSEADADAYVDLALLQEVEEKSDAWFKPDMQRNDARQFLVGKEDGCFVVRQSSQANAHAITIAVGNNKMWNGLIKRNDDGTFQLNHTSKKFKSIAELICMSMDEIRSSQWGLPCALVLPEDDTMI